MKLCIDCKWHRILSTSWRFAVCAHPTMVKPAIISPVDGQEEFPPPEMCGVLRSEYGKCGPEAKLFEGREEA